MLSLRCKVILVGNYSVTGFLRLFKTLFSRVHRNLEASVCWWKSYRVEGGDETSRCLILKTASEIIVHLLLTNCKRVPR